MSSIYGIVTGPGLYDKLPAQIRKTTHSALDFTDDSIFADNEDLLNSLDFITPQVVDSWERIILTDYGFSDMSNTYESVRTFQAIQDKLVSLGVRRVKVNYLTNDSNMYEQLKQGLDGFDGIIYPNTEVFMLHQNLGTKAIINTMRGEMDGRGFHIKKAKPMSRIERYEQERKKLMMDAQTVSSTILEYEKDIPATKLSGSDYADLEASKIRQEEEWVEEAAYQGEFDDIDEKYRDDRYDDRDVDIRVHKYDGGRPTLNDAAGVRRQQPTRSTPQPTKPKPKVSQPNPDTAVSRRSSSFVRGGNADVDRIDGIDDLRYLYNQLLQDSSTVTDAKLEGDKGTTVLVTGMDNSGSSGVVAQMAEVYAMVGLRVLIIDLDITKRMQPVYFSNFDSKIAEGYGLSNGILNVANGGGVRQASVPVTSRVSICGLSRSFSKVSDTEAKSITYSLEDVCQSAHESGFDIILIDAPFRYLDSYASSLSMVNRVLMVLDNKHYDLEHFLGVMVPEFVESNALLGREFVRKMSIVLNKMRPNTRDTEGIIINQEYVKNLLYKEGNPYDNIFVVGEIPFYDRWEDQFLTNKRYVWDNDIFLGLIKNILREAV